MKNFDLNTLRQIKLIAFDIDGTLTDGSLYFGSGGEALKVFNVKDGYAIKEAENNGYKIYFITGRTVYEPSKQRIIDLKLSLECLKDKVADKVSCAEQILNSHGLNFSQMAYMGDDLPDLPLLRRVAFAGAPSDCTQRLIDDLHFLSNFPAGKGAAREFIDLILSAK